MSVEDYENPIIEILYAEDVEPDWLIPNMVLQGTLVCLAGEPGAGKSYISYTIGLAVASGCSALSGVIPVGKPRTVVYFDQENSIQNRNKYVTRSWWGLADKKGEPPDAVLLDRHFIPVHFRLGDEDWFDTAAEFIERFKPDLMVFDTAASVFGMEDENDNAEAARIIQKIRQLMAMRDPAITAMVLKHAKSASEKGAKRKMRGASMWQSLADAVMFQVRAPGRPRRDGLAVTRLEPDKTRAYGLTQTVYITPSYTDAKRTGLKLEGSYEPDSEHRRKLDEEEGDD